VVGESADITGFTECESEDGVSGVISLVSFAATPKVSDLILQRAGLTRPENRILVALGDLMDVVVTRIRLLQTRLSEFGSTVPFCFTVFGQ
jgi:hypothetical protein